MGFFAMVSSPKRKRLSQMSSSTTSTQDRPEVSHAPSNHHYSTLSDYYVPEEATSSDEARQLDFEEESTALSRQSTLHENARPAPPARVSSYEAFMSHARETEARRQDAWRKADERRRENAARPQDPWRGGFGPPGRNAGYGAPSGGIYPRSERRNESPSANPLRGWLKGNGLARS